VINTHTAFIDTTTVVALLICFWNEHNANAKKVSKRVLWRGAVNRKNVLLLIKIDTRIVESNNNDNDSTSQVGLFVRHSKMT
jgi:hypothetical protein